MVTESVNGTGRIGACAPAMQDCVTALNSSPTPQLILESVFGVQDTKIPEKISPNRAQEFNLLFILRLFVFLAAFLKFLRLNPCYNLNKFVIDKNEKSTLVGFIFSLYDSSGSVGFDKGRL
jgi:hypothetical protein